MQAADNAEEDYALVSLSIPDGRLFEGQGNAMLCPHPSCRGNSVSLLSLDGQHSNSGGRPPDHGRAERWHAKMLVHSAKFKRGKATWHTN